MSYSREELLELAASYALGATTPEETAAIEAALPNSPELAAEVASFREVTVELAQIARPSAVAPSAGVRDQLLRLSNQAPKTEPLRARSRWMPMLAAASVVGLLALGSGALIEWSRARSLSAQLDHREETLNTLLHAEKDLRVVHMKAADTVKGPGIQFFWNEKHGTGVAHAFRLEPAPANRAYQLWIIQNGKPVSVKVFNSDPDGHALVENLELPRTTTGVTDLYLTEEPAGGSPLPTTTPILHGVVSSTF